MTNFCTFRWNIKFSRAYCSFQLTWAIRMPVRRLMVPCGWTRWSLDRILPTSDVRVARTSTLYMERKEKSTLPYKYSFTIFLLWSSSNSSTGICSVSTAFKSNIWIYVQSKEYISIQIYNLFAKFPKSVPCITSMWPATAFLKILSWFMIIISPTLIIIQLLLYFKHTETFC